MGVDLHLLNVISDISIHTCIMFVFLTGFFFYISSNIEANVVKRQLKILAYGTNIQKLNLNKNIKTILIKKLKEKNKKVVEDDSIDKNNKNIINRSIYISIFVIFIGIIINIILYHVSNYKLDLTRILYYNIFTMVFVFITELMFIYIIAQNVNIINPTEIYKYIINNILE